MAAVAIEEMHGQDDPFCKPRTMYESDGGASEFFQLAFVVVVCGSSGVVSKNDGFSHG